MTSIQIEKTDLKFAGNSQDGQYGSRNDATKASFLKQNTHSKLDLNKTLSLKNKLTTTNV